MMMGTLDNFTSANHSSVGSSNGQHSENVQVFGHSVSTPCVPVFSPVSKMLKPQVFVTRQHGCSQDCQPQTVPNENILFGVFKCFSQVITKLDTVVAGLFVRFTYVFC